MRKKVYNRVSRNDLEAKRDYYLFSWFIVANRLFGRVAFKQHDKARRGLCER